MSPGKNQKLKRTTLICVFLASLLTGLYLSKETSPLAAAWLLVPVILLPLVFGKPRIILVYLVLAGGLLGWWRGGVLQSQNQNYQDLYYYG